MSRNLAMRLPKYLPFVEMLEDRTLLNVDLRIVTYNITFAAGNSPTADANLKTILKAIGDEPNQAGDARPIDVLALQEISLTGSDGRAVAELLNQVYDTTVYVADPFVGGSLGGGTQMLVYNSSTIMVVPEGSKRIGVTDPDAQLRQTIRHQLRPIEKPEYGANYDFYIYNSHLKASTGTSNRDNRADEVHLIRQDADSLPPGANIIYVGDFNAYGPDEPFYAVSTVDARTSFLDAGNGRAMDVVPAAATWHENAAFRRFFTQDPGTQMDDRFDFQLLTEEFADHRGLEYSEGSYHAFGNGGTFEKPVNDVSSDAWRDLTNPLFSRRDAILAALAAVTDHLPVVADYQIVPDGVRVTASGGRTEIAEGGLTDDVSVVLTSAPQANVTITLNPPSGAALLPALLVLTSANWNVPQTVTITAIDDGIYQGTRSEWLSFLVTSTAAGYADYHVPDLPLSILDNDTADVFITAMGDPVAVVEGGAAGNYAIQLTGDVPGDNVTITPVVSSQVTVSPTSLVFTPGNWSIPQSFTVTAIDDFRIEGNQIASITHIVTSSDARYLGLPPTIVGVNVTDNDEADDFLYVYGTGGNDQITILPSATRIQVIVNRKATFYPVTYQQIKIFAGGGADTIRLGNSAIAAELWGESGRDTVQIDGQTTANTFVISGSRIDANARPVDLFDVESVVLNGNKAADQVSVRSGRSYSVTFNGAGGVDTLTGPDLAAIWQVTGASAGTLTAGGAVTFTATENLNGGSADDKFVFSAGKSIGGRIDGGLGQNNTLDYSAYRSAITANLHTKTITGAKAFDRIGQIIGGAGSDKLIGTNTALNSWEITSPNAGEFRTAAGATVAFSSFENLVGGSLSDAFIVGDQGAIKGRIDGAAGEDLLAYVDYAPEAIVLVNRSRRTATGTGGWLNIERFMQDGDPI